MSVHQKLFPLASRILRLFLNNHVFILFALSLFFKNVLFHWCVFHEFRFSSFVYHPLDFWCFYFPKLVPALYLASLTFVLKRRWWTVVLSVLIDVWCFANIVYFRVNGLLLSVDIIFHNSLGGFESSVLPFISPILFLFPILTVAYVLLLFLFRKSFCFKRKWKSFLVTLLVALVCSFSASFYNYNTYYKNSASGNKLSFFQYASQIMKASKYDAYKMIFPDYIDNSWPYYYTKCQSIDGYAVVALFHYFYCNSLLQHLELTDDERRVVDGFCNYDGSSFPPQRNLIIILVESFESWCINNAVGPIQILPNINHFVNENNVLFCSRVQKQVLYGNSADGQMIINTGLLPISNGVAALLYGYNCYPNLASFYPNSCTVNPFPTCWNQEVVTYSYGYHHLLEPKKQFSADLLPWPWNDLDVVQHSLQFLRSANAPTCLQLITVNTHTPFERPNGSFLKFPDNVPDAIARYMDCMNYTDSCLHDLLTDTAILNNSVIVITGDHTILNSDELRNEYKFVADNFLSNKPMDYDNYVPLIIYSPDFSESRTVDSVCYQMDIYTTIRSVVGISNGWRGFGIDLSAPSGPQRRPISPQQAFLLSDKIIRSNFFASHLPSPHPVD